MLSISPVKTGNAFTYYGKEDNYYFMGHLTHQWLGKGAAELGLKGEIDGELFNALLKGRLPDGTEMKNAGTDIRRQGFDLTFSAPKSISVLALIGGRKELVEMHNQAVKAAFQEIERIASIRLTKDGDTHIVPTGKLVAATFNHDTSRNLDPQLHTHVIVANASAYENNWRALSSDKINKTGFYDVIYNHRLSFGKIYQHTLRHLVEQAGFETVDAGKHGLFEIQGIPDSVLHLFSSRRQEIANAVTHPDSLKSRDIAAVATRQHKQNPDRETLRRHWHKAIEYTGWDMRTFLAEAEKQVVHREDLSDRNLCHDIARQAVQESIELLGDKYQQYSYSDLLHEALDKSNYVCRADDIRAMIIQAIHDKHLLPQKADKSWLSSASTTAHAKAVSSLAKQIHCYNTVPSFRAVTLQLEKQRHSDSGLIQLLEQNPAISVLRGHSTLKNKIALADEIVNMNRMHGRHVHVVTENQHRKNQYTCRMKFHTPVVTSHQLISALEEKGDHVLYSNSTLIIDAAEKWSLQHMHTLLKTAGNKNLQLILIDSELSRPQRSSSVLSALKDAVIPEINTGKQHQPATTTVHSQPDRFTRLQQMASDYVTLKQEGKQVVAKLSGVREQKELTGMIRDELREQGLLQPAHREVTVQTPVYLDHHNRHKLSRYKTGDRLSCYNTATRRTQYYTVKAIEKTAQVLVLNDAKGNDKQLPVNKITDAWQLYRPEKQVMHVGEQLAVLTRDKKMQLNKGDTLTITRFAHHKVYMQQGRRKIVMPEDQLNAGFAYISSVSDDVSAKTVYDSVLVSLKNNELNKNTLNTVGQSAREVQLYTAVPEKVAQEKLSQLYPQYKADTIKTAGEVQLQSDIVKAVDRGIMKAGANAVSFTRSQLVSAVAEFCSELDKINEEIERRIAERELREIATGSQQHLLPESAYQAEKTIIDCIQAGKGQYSTLCNNDFSLPESFTKGQKQAASAILTTTDQFIAIQGYAGTGKTALLKTVKEILQQRHVHHKTSGHVKTMLGIAPTHQAVKEMQNVGITAQTLKSFLMEADKIRLEGGIPDYSDKLILIDESSMIGNSDMAEVYQNLKAGNARVVALGDSAQLLSPEAGAPFKLMQQRSPIDTVIMKDIIRQRTREGKVAVYRTLAGDFQGAMQKISQLSPLRVPRTLPQKAPDSSVVDMTHPNNSKASIHETIASDYLSRTLKAREETLIVAHIKRDKEAINQAIHAGLVQQGDIEHKEYEVSRLKRITDNRADMYSVTHYKKHAGKVIKLDGSYFYIESVNTHHKTAQLKRIDTGENRLFSPDENHTRNIAFYEKDTISISVGDKLRLTQTDKNLGREANESFTIADITKGIITLRNSNQKTVHLQPDKYIEDQHIDYDYARTGYGVQGASKRYAISLEGSRGARQYLATPRSWYVSISRNKDHVQIYTDGTDELLKQFSRYQSPPTVHDVLEKQPGNNHTDDLQQVLKKLNKDKAVNADNVHQIQQIMDKRNPQNNVQIKRLISGEQRDLKRYKPIHNQLRSLFDGVLSDKLIVSEEQEK